MNERRYCKKLREKGHHYENVSVLCNQLYACVYMCTSKHGCVTTYAYSFLSTADANPLTLFGYDSNSDDDSVTGMRIL